MQGSHTAADAPDRKVEIALLVLTGVDLGARIWPTSLRLTTRYEMR